MRSAQPPASSPSFLARVLHRWLVEFNPLYLLSAALVLCGTQLMSRGLASQGSELGAIGVSAVAELYAWALLGGAALLMRIRLRRPAVMLALLAALYQGDVTLHTETTVYLGAVGTVAACAWLMSFVAKLYMFGWALRLRLSRSALAVPTLGALGLAVLPRCLFALDVQTRSTLVASWLFILFASGLWMPPQVTSRTPLDAWGNTVLRRALTAAWISWAVLALAHVWFWSDVYAFAPVLLLPIGALLSTRWMQSEPLTWLVVYTALLFAGLFTPHSFWLIALMAATVSCLHGLKRRTRTTVAGAPLEPSEAYRTRTQDAYCQTASVVSFGPALPQVRLRFCAASLFCTYLSVWTMHWSGGPLPAHSLPLDLLLSIAALFLGFKARVRSALLGLGVTYLHLAVQTRFIAAPASTFQWGVLCAAAGFALLAISLAASLLLRLRRRRPAPS